MSEDRDISDLVKKARECIEAAKDLFRSGYYDFSSSRSYYAMFYVTEAVLLTKDLSFSKHSAVIGAFGKEFIKTKIFRRELWEYVVSAFDMRQLGDYGASGSIDKEDAQILIEQAGKFIDSGETYLRLNGYIK